MVSAHRGGPTAEFPLGLGPISCHAWNADRTRLAVAAGSAEIRILRRSGGGGGGGWETEAVLREHDLPVTGLDWAPRTNRIVSCAQDKNAFVWTLVEGVWRPELVLVRLSRAATSVAWSPKENKFAVGSGAKLVSVCYYDQEGDWWIAKHIKGRIRSTVLSIDWHPNNVLLAVGSCDFKARVFSAYVKEVDEKPAPTPWGAKMPLAQCLAEYSSGGGGWVHSIRFSPSGNRLAWVGHDSSLSVVDATAQDSLTTVKEWYLPFTSLCWASEASLVGAGHDCCPMLFTFHGPQRLAFVSKLDIPPEAKESKLTAMSKFRNLDKSAAETVNAKLNTLHQNTITQIGVERAERGRVSAFSTVGIDGLLVLWDLQSLEAKNSSIKIV